jgi:hypothetical protein
MAEHRGIPVKPAGTLPLARVAFDVERMSGPRRRMWRRVERAFAQPFVGVTTTGEAVGDLRTLGDDGFDPVPATRAALAILAMLTPAELAATRHAVDAPAWRRWTNAFATWEPHGLLLSTAAEPVRAAVVDLLRASLSAAGVRAARDCMRLNETLAELVGDHDNLGE